ncbi:hypothetical protein WME76_31755 [Sorangium sp. So ce119]|uniref:hypothetical protein n=1 Tax=Sorangium sp. So ce119 TaxID=3133279 RepID=UPI003F5D7AAE
MSFLFREAQRLDGHALLSMVHERMNHRGTEGTEERERERARTYTPNILSFFFSSSVPSVPLWFKFFFIMGLGKT